MNTHACCDEHAADHAKRDRSHALQSEIAAGGSGTTSRHYLAGMSPRSPLSPLQVQRMGRDLWRETLQGQRHARRSNSALGPRHGHQTKLRARPANEDGPMRRSLDSQRTDIDRRGCGLGVTEGDGYSRPMWSDEQLRRARRFSSSHTRGASCPTLNITRIMRSISVSAGHSGSSGASRFGPRQARQEQNMPASSGCIAPIELCRQQKQQHNHQNALLDEVTLPVLSTIKSCSGEESQAASSTTCSDVPDSQSPLCIRTDVCPMAAPAPVLCLSEGLRRRISVRQREAGTPDFMAQSEAASPLPLEEKEEEVCSEPHHFFEPASGPQQFMSLSPLSPPPLSAPSTSSACSSARWSTISAESPHKRYSYSSSAIAEALRNLRSVAKGDFLGDSDSNSVGRGSGDESMTIILKAPRNLGDREGGGDCAAGIAGSNRSRGDTLGDSLPPITQTLPGNSESFVLSDPPSLRPSSESNEVAIPAVYLDGAASLWDQYVAELESSEFDPNIHLKRQRVSQFMRVPWHVEKLLWFGIAICFDALVYVFSIMPAKFVRALLQLAAALLFELPVLVEQACMSSYAQVAIGALPTAWAERLVLAGHRAQHLAGRLSGRLGHGATLGGNVVRWLSPTQLFDFYRGLLLIFTCAILSRMDAAQMYHSIRAQSSLKLYFIFSALDIFDRLLSSFGHDVVDALQSTVTDPRSLRWKSGLAYFVLAQIYMLVHTLVLFYQVITLNVAVNAYSDQLLALLISNQFVEIKSNVFKKWEKEMLFQVVCADVVERFQEIVFLFIIILRNLAELAGPGLSPSTGAAASTAQAPVSFDSATPSAFGPLLPAWISVPLLNRILTPVLMVLGTEILIDWIKHAFITKLNWIRPEIYSHYIDILSCDLACSKAGVRAKGIPPTHSAPGSVAAATASMADEKICAMERQSEDSDGSEQQHEVTMATSPRSSSILVHAVLKAFAWMQANILAESRQPPALAANRTPAPSRRRRGHQRTQSVTQPQLFVEQSTRVARRLGLSPMPLACLVMLMLMQVLHMLAASSSASALLLSSRQAVPGSSGYSQLLSMAAGWSALDVLGWLILGLIAYALVVWTKLAFANRLMHFAWTRYHEFELRTREAASGTDSGRELPVGLKRFDDSTKRLDRDSFMEVGKLIGKERAEIEWEKQRPKWTLDNIERYSLFKSRIP
ncbi:hypothetical protein GGI20_000888 [Coemansia sp. BCRC 34301]|nr:hypothetical protein GGI20_000888 [Coemansia sp. BCRC 34301]